MEYSFGRKQKIHGIFLSHSTVAKKKLQIDVMLNISMLHSLRPLCAIKPKKIRRNQQSTRFIWHQRRRYAGKWVCHRIVCDFSMFVEIFTATKTPNKRKTAWQKFRNMKHQTLLKS